MTYRRTTLARVMRCCLLTGATVGINTAIAFCQVVKDDHPALADRGARLEWEALGSEKVPVIISSAPRMLAERSNDQPDFCNPSLYTADVIGELVVQSARRHQIDETFALAIAFVESRYGQVLNSPKGARGPMQLMAATAGRFDVTDICDARQNVDAGVRYLRLLQVEFGNPFLVAAAYNSGEARVREYRGIPPFHETVNYVANVINRQIELQSAGRAAIGHRPPWTSAPISAARPAGGATRSVEKRTFVGGVMHF